MTVRGRTGATTTVRGRAGAATTVAVVLGLGWLAPPATAAPPTSAAPVAVQGAAPVAGEAVPSAEDLVVDEVPVVVDDTTPAAATAVPEPELSDALPEAVVVEAGAQGAGERVESDAVPVDPYQTLGVTWPADAAAQDVEVQVRTRTDGDWSAWMPLESDGVTPDPGTAEAGREVRAGTEAVWIGGAQDVQVAFADGAQVPSDVRIALVGDPATDEAQDARGEDQASRSVERTASATTTGDATATAVTPTLVPAPGITWRSGWGAAPQLCAPDVASTLLATVVHHTAGPNTYSTIEEAKAQIRGDQQYHQQARGWCDIGYNFLVDKWGNIYEGRANSATEPVIGVHAGGFNTATLGISMLGDYSSVTPGANQQESVAWLIAWRMSQYHRDPASTIGYTTLGGENSRYPAGTWLALPVVIGHRDVAYTACPGERGYSTLGWLRTRARQIIGATFVNPSLSTTSATIGSSVTVQGGVNSTIAWTLQVVDQLTGYEVRRVTGVAGSSSGGPIATWDGRNATGGVVGPGTYRLTLSGTEQSTGGTVKPWSGTVTLSGSQNPPTEQPVPLVGDLGFVPVTPARLLDTRTTGGSLGPASRMDLDVTGSFGVPDNAKAVALNVTAVGTSQVTFVRVWPAGQPAPGSSTFNTDGRRTTNAGVVVGVGGGGKVSLYNNAGTTHLVVDVTGYFVEGAGTGSGYTPLATGARVLDTRSDGGRLTSDKTRAVQVAGREGIPSDARAVLVNVTSVMPAGQGNVIAYPSGGTVPTVASVNHLPGNNVSNRSIVPLGADGKVALALQGAAADVVLDVVGWFGPTGELTFTPIQPTRGWDTRAVAGGPLNQQEARDLSVAAANLPADAKVALVSLVATGTTAGMTFLTAWQPGSARPTASDLNGGAGRDVANLVAVPIGPDRGVRVYNDLGRTDVVMDVQGWFG
ncbi:peptidoglycan recognition protein family protein [Cellulomonas fimi]|uniref:N-acetylmuramoyl-L-alanine amidase family 2 n=1 Tax=Cellulomonas fimi (strain ATCC 484 / DSM 20113 / JCM 1341 / CCUG 24087 / LMG 16345 / NBRC 15513 / NCIMB 8980 / NCTC 7547 / NRS-133) TaxID=590998 RepID=F4H531_CELFA|nr:N-acetylmuramoyl-L-alanine amidase [Cellulomonas fimi]AEE46637.1 N-acetylmuramoyl-L-alanine amidase family 2 [Cellulomonas fimi ATCC 484]NNH08331.1 hypothetical protein [Cellulomonas fimi]VEH33735.1 Uncharacterized protein potentially involved in peptidoglycan biosynthesis [Cellulomonas fimi]